MNGYRGASPVEAIAAARAQVRLMQEIAPHLSLRQAEAMKRVALCLTELRLENDRLRKMLDAEEARRGLRE